MATEIKTENYSNGQREFEIPFVNGVPHGVEKRWYENGQKESEILYINGQKNGIEKWWYDNRQRRLEHQYINGEVHGLARWWHRDGSLEYLVKWNQNQMVWVIVFPSEEKIPDDVEVELFFHPTPELS